MQNENDKLENKKLMMEQYESEMRGEYFYFKDDVEDVQSEIYSH